MLIAMAVYDTVSNGRTDGTWKTFSSLRKQVDLSRHRLIIVDNASTDTNTLELYRQIETAGWVREGKLKISVIRNESNLGTAKAINKAWRLRQPGEHCVKMDNDVVVHEAHWPDRMEEVFARAPMIGICGLKRKDVEERPNHDNPWYQSELIMLPHQAGERWLVVEQVQHVIGTCQGYNSALLDKIGYLYQLDGLYGFDDALAAARCKVAKFGSVFLPTIEIDHVDNCCPIYTKWKQDHAGTLMEKYHTAVAGYMSGELPIYYEDK